MDLVVFTGLLATLSFSNRQEVKRDTYRYYSTFGSPTSSLILHNTFNRQTGTVKEFFGTSELVYPKNMLKFHGYIASDSWDKDDLTEIFQYIEHSGFGADKSTGRGAIRLESIEEAEPFLTPNTNAVMSLSLGLPGCIGLSKRLHNVNYGRNLNGKLGNCR